MLLSLMTTGVIMTGFSVTSVKKKEMVVVCHTDHEINQSQTIRVPVSELNDHLEHGDNIGFCQVKPEKTTRFEASRR